MKYKMIKKAEGAFIADSAKVMGDVKMGKDSCAWYGAVIRGDEASITIGKETNIQDNSVVHGDPGFDVVIGEHVTIGHGCIIHGCTIGDGSLIGMGAIILNGAKIGKNCLVGAGALVTGKADIPDGSMVVGSPAKVKRELTQQEIEANHHNTDIYIELAHEHFAE